MLGPAGNLSIDYGAPANPAAPLNRGLSAWWLTLPNRRGLTWFDLYNRTNGTLTLGPLWHGGGRVGGYGSLSFDGSDDYVALGSTSPTAIATPISITAWVYMTANGSYPCIISRTGAFNEATAKWVFYCEGAGRQLKFAAGGTLVTTFATAITTGEWTFVGISADTTDATYYLHGGGASATSSHSGISEPSYSTETAAIGRWGDAAGGNWPGYIDDVRLYNRKLTVADFAAIRAASLVSYQVELKRFRSIWYDVPAAAAAAGHHRRAGLLTLGVGA